MSRQWQRMPVPRWDRNLRTDLQQSGDRDVAHRHTGRRSGTRRFLALLLILALLTYACVRGTSRFLHRDRIAIERVLGSCPGVERVEVAEHSEHPLSWSAMQATVWLQGGGERVIVIDVPDAEELQSGRRILLRQVGQHLFAYLDDSQTLGGAAFDVGSAGEFKDLFPFRLNNVCDLTKQYDEVEAALARVPLTGTIVGADRVRYTYVITSDGTDPPLPTASSSSLPTQ